MLARSWRILVIDDHHASRAVTCHVLGLCGHQCHGVETAASALFAIDTFAPDAVVLEWRLGGGEGIGLARALRERTGESRRRLVVMIASTADEPPGFRGQEQVDGYFTKPISMVRIAEALVAFEAS